MKFFTNLDSWFEGCRGGKQNSLTHLLWHLMVTFDICQLLVTPGLFEYFCQNTGPSENQSFLNEGVKSGWWGFGVSGGQMTRLHDGTIFGGNATHLRGCQGPLKKNCIFQHICNTLKGTRIHWFYQESVHRCSLGCSTYLDMDFWICDRLAICWVVRWQFLICQKVAHFLGGLSLHLNHLIASCNGICYRQFGTLPIGIFFVKFGLKTAWHISYDIFWSLLTYVNFWRLQGCLSTFAKIRGPQKIKVFSMKEWSVVDEAWGV